MNILAERSFPSFFKGYAPKLLKFFSCWLDWTEAPGNAQYILNHLSTEQDIDESIDSYRNHLKKKLLPEFPERISTDLKLLLKNVLWLYRAKSSRKAYDFMFRVLFNSPARIWHPRDLMLKTSDGVWDIPQYVGIANVDGMSVDWLIENCLGWRMTGLDSRAEAFVSAASSGFSGTIECRASELGNLARVSFYSNYKDAGKRQLMPKLGKVECDPTMSAFRITNPEPNSESELTAVWSINKENRTTPFLKGQEVVEIGTRNFKEPSISIEGSSELYDAINLEALVTTSRDEYIEEQDKTVTITSVEWVPIEIVSTDGMLVGHLAGNEDETANAFVVAIEDTNEVSFTQILPVRRRGYGTDEKELAHFYLEVANSFHHGTLSKTMKKTARLTLASSRFGECHLEAFSLLSKETITAFGDQRISIAELMDWSDTPLHLVYDTQTSFEAPISNCSAIVTYDFDKRKYVAILNRPLEKNADVSCEVGGVNTTVIIPAGETEGELNISLPDRIIVTDSKNIFGALLDAPTAHFAPGEKVRLLNPDTGEIAQIIDPETGLLTEANPTVLWHAESTGHYASTKGFLSDINAIQDNYYYQNYSYVVQSDVGIGEWRRIVKQLLHPAGLEIFGEMLIEGELEDGSGIYYHDAWSFLKKSFIFFKSMVGMANQAIQHLHHVLSTSRLAQRHSITTDLWLHWMQTTGNLRADIQAIKREIAASNDPEERKDLERQLHEMEALLSSPYMEDIRDWYDIRPSDVDETLNANSVLLFRNDGTLIDPLIVDWVDFSFTEDIDESFLLRGEEVAPHTTSIWGTTLHPLHPMINGRIVGNEYVLQDGQEFIPKMHMTFVGSTQESSGVLVRTLVVGNEVLQYAEIERPDMHEAVRVGDTDLEKLARKHLFGSNQSVGFGTNGIGRWGGLLIGDFIYVNTDGGLIFNGNSLTKVPDAWVEAQEKDIIEINPSTNEEEIVGTEQKYVFNRNAWNDEKISIVSYSPYDFSYRIWIERLNAKIQLTITAFNSSTPPDCWLANSNIVPVDNGHSESVDLIHVQESGWNGEPTNVYAATSSWTMEFKDPARLSSWFDIELPEAIDNDRILCFINGLMQPKSRIDGKKISIDTIADNGSISYSSNEWNFGDLSLEECVDEECSATAPVMVSVNESDNVAFQELDLNDLMVINQEIETIRLGDCTLQSIVFDIVGCSISSTLSYAEIYILAPIEASRKLQYPWFGWSMENANGDVVWPFTYDNARLFPYASHHEDIFSYKDAELNPDKEAIKPKTHWEVAWHNVSHLLNGFQREIVISETVASQRQSETVDRILDTWWNDASRRMQADFLKNEHWLASANFSSTLVFGKDGLLVDPRGFNWSMVSGDGGHGVGLPEKFWSRPLIADVPVEFGEVADGAISSNEDTFKQEGFLAFIDGKKILDTDIQADNLEYHFPAAYEGKEASIFSMGHDWIQRNGNQIGYFNAVKSNAGWTLTARQADGYVQADVLDRIDDIDLGEFIGLSMGRNVGAIWAEDDSIQEIRGTTEVTFKNGDKRRFVDLGFLDMVDILAYEGTPRDPARSTRLYGVQNYRLFGTVERIVDLDPRFFMVFIDGCHSPMESREWRYLKGTFFVDKEPESSIEVYIGNPLSYLAPDYAKCAPEGVGELAFNNLRTNVVPRHMLTTTLFRTFEIGHMHFGRSIEVSWRVIPLNFSLGYEREHAIATQRRVRNMSETFDDVAFWKQMDPSAWVGIGFNPLAKTGRSSIMAFNADGSLIDPHNIDYHNGVIDPWIVGNVVEILTPESGLRTGWVYWPVYEVDPEAHKETVPDGRFKTLRETDYTIVRVDGYQYDLERHFRKELQDVHTEESVWTYPRPDDVIDLGPYEFSMTDAWWDGKDAFPLRSELMILSDVVADAVEETVGQSVAIAIDAQYPMVRNVQVVLQDGEFIIPVPRIGGELVFIDGVKIAEGSYRKLTYVDGVLCGDSYEDYTLDIPEGCEVQYALVIEDPVWKDDDEHITAVYWPAEGWAERSTGSGSLEEQILGCIQPEWKDLGFDTFHEYVESRVVLFCNGKMVHVSGNANLEIFLDGVKLDAYECQSYELYVVDISNSNCRASDSWLTEAEQSFIYDNQQRNWFMEAHTDETLWRMLGLPMPSISSRTETETLNEMNMPVLNGDRSLDIRQDWFVANNRDTLDNVFCNGSIPVRQYMNPSLYVERISKVEILDLDPLDWKVLGKGENVDDLEFVAIDVEITDENGVPTGEHKHILVSLARQNNQLDGKLIFKTDYVPQSWDFYLYATSRENPTYFYPSERLDVSKWMYYQGWNQRLDLVGLEPDKDIYIVETLDVSMPDTYTNTDVVYWLEKEFNKKSTLMIDHDGLLEHPDGLEWKDGIHIFPHKDTWTAQAEEAEFPAVVTELVPDNVQKALIMDLCIDDMVRYDGAIAEVGDACIDSMVATNARIYRTSKWEVLANKDYIYWEEGEFHNWHGWLLEDDVFDRTKCFVFVNGLKIPDWAWTYDEEQNLLTVPYEDRQNIERLGFIKKKDIYDEVIYEDNVQSTLIDPDYKVVHEEEYNVPVIVDSNWAIWKDENGMPIWGDQAEIGDDKEVVVAKPDPREGIIWPISRIWRRYDSCDSEGFIDVPEYLGYDLSKYVMAWVNGRLVQCTFDGTRIFVPGYEDAETIEVYVFELHDGAWVERFDGKTDSFTLTSFRDMKVC